MNREIRLAALLWIVVLVVSAFLAWEITRSVREEWTPEAMAAEAGR
jgi:hypothetical protein